MAKCNGPQWVSTDYHKYEVVIRETGPNREDNISTDCTETCWFQVSTAHYYSQSLLLAD